MLENLVYRALPSFIGTFAAICCIIVVTDIDVRGNRHNHCFDNSPQRQVEEVTPMREVSVEIIFDQVEVELAKSESVIELEPVLIRAGSSWQPSCTSRVVEYESDPFNDAFIIQRNGAKYIEAWTLYRACQDEIDAALSAPGARDVLEFQMLFEAYARSRYIFEREISRIISRKEMVPSTCWIATGYDPYCYGWGFIENVIEYKQELEIGSVNLPTYFEIDVNDLNRFYPKSNR